MRDQIIGQIRCHSKIPKIFINESNNRGFTVFDNQFNGNINFQQWQNNRIGAITFKYFANTTQTLWLYDNNFDHVLINASCVLINIIRIKMQLWMIFK